MSKEKFDTTNKLIKPGDVPTSDNDVLKQLSDNLQGITTEEVDTMCDEIDINKIKEILNTTSTKLTLGNAILMIDNGYYKIILENMGNFDKADHKKIMLKIIEYLTANPKKFDKKIKVPFKTIYGLDKEVASVILDSNDKNLLDFFEATYFTGLDDEIASRLIDLGYGKYVSENIKYFYGSVKKTILLLAKHKVFVSFDKVGDNLTWLDNEKFEDDLIATGYPCMLCNNITHFPAKNHKRIALKLIDSWIAGKCNLDTLKNFKNLDKKTAIALIDAGCYHRGKSLNSLCYFGSYNSSRERQYALDKEIAMKILNDKETLPEQIEWIARHPKVFNGLDSEVAMILINAGFAGYVASSHEFYVNLNDEVANALIDKGCANQVKQHIESYIGITMKTKFRLRRKAK